MLFPFTEWFEAVYACKPIYLLFTDTAIDKTGHWSLLESFLNKNKKLPQPGIEPGPRG